jgi:hypothetical protein
MQVVGFSPILGAISAMLVWAAHFLLVYGAQATACARGATGATLFGQPLVPALVLGLTAVSLLAVGVIGLRAWRRLRSGLSGQEGEDEPQFTVWMTAAIALLAALAIIWEAAPAVILRPCT